MSRAIECHGRTRAGACWAMSWSNRAIRCRSRASSSSFAKGVSGSATATPLPETKRDSYSVGMLANRYGRWTVLDPRGTYRAHDKVPVRCDCGTETGVLRYKLTQGRSKSCGCYKADRLRGTDVPDLAPERDDHIAPGTRHGRWTALTLPYTEPGRRDRVALCRCQCGEEKTVVTYDLLSGASKSCGCLVPDTNRARLQNIN